MMPTWAAALLICLWLLAVLFWRVNRIWLPYYITGTVGLAFVLIFLASSVTPAQTWMQLGVVRSVHWLSGAIGIPTNVFDREPSALLILVVSQEIGWTMLQVSVESSALLETCVLISMVAFYPGWGLRKKAVLILFGAAATFAANIVRMMMIASSLHYFGKDILLISHVVLGRIVFFVFVVLIFWLVVTAPTLKTVYQKLHKEAQA